MKKLSREFYTRADTLQIARDLLGKILVVPTATGERVSGIIVETEAYLGVEDKAAHSYGNRRTKRTETMFAAGGTVYIFFIYGMYLISARPASAMRQRTLPVLFIITARVFCKRCRSFTLKFRPALTAPDFGRERLNCSGR